jgi:hypothetical protein
MRRPPSSLHSDYGSAEDRQLGRQRCIGDWRPIQHRADDHRAMTRANTRARENSARQFPAAANIWLCGEPTRSFRRGNRKIGRAQAGGRRIEPQL